MAENGVSKIHSNTLNLYSGPRDPLVTIKDVFPLTYYRYLEYLQYGTVATLIIKKATIQEGTLG
jgi:hypothetical protein